MSSTRQLILDPESEKSFWHEHGIQLLLSKVEYSVAGEAFTLTPTPLHAEYFPFGAWMGSVCIRYQVILCSLLPTTRGTLLPASPDTDGHDSGGQDPWMV
jgi:hypothetical protein